MKKILSIMVALFIIAATPELQAADKKSEKKVKKEMKRKAFKAARKEARNFRKAGWYVAPGALPMDKQVEKSWERQYEEDENGYPLYLVGTGNSVAETQSAAKLQAMELAKLELAGVVQTNIIAIIENSVANNQLSREDAASVTKTVAASKNIIAQEIGRVVTFFEIYRPVGDANIESSVRIGYNTEIAYETANKAIKEQLEDRTEELHKKLDKILDF
jgi:1,6-anhydro-N-acetylmuramate kinase